VIDFGVLREWLQDAKWKHKHGPGTDYYVWDVSDRFPGKARAFFLRIAPGGMVHPHVDTCRTVTTHYCVETNDRAVMVFGGEEIRLKPGESRVVDRTVEHYSRNDGETDRIHLLVEDLA
jgi:oxalate decarboxylase/phosphoglucose isomerase-like protein (cupin superfamily)